MTHSLAAPPLSITNDERSVLEKFAKSRTMAHRTVLRARALLLAADGVANNEIAELVDVNPNSVRMWRRRFEEEGVDGVGKVAPGRGRKPSLPEGTVAQVVSLTMNELPEDGSTQWSTRSLAKHMNISHVTVARIWKDHGLKPWKLDTFEVSTDPHFEEKLVDVVGLYMNPPERAVVFSFDEKTQVQALDRTQPSLPMKKGRGTMTHDYKRHGTTTLFAALDVLAGKVIGDCYKRHRHQEFLRFLRRINREFPGKKPLHLVMDNYGTHGTPEVKDWLNQHPRFNVHYVPTSSSWLNLIERWFGELTSKRIRRDSFLSVDDLIAAINEFLAAWNEKPKPFVWTATVESIVAKLARCRQTPEQIQPGWTARKTRKRKSS